MRIDEIERQKQEAKAAAEAQTQEGAQSWRKRAPKPIEDERR